MSVPSLIAQLVNLLYNLVDRMYIGRLPEVGTLALTGLGLCNPIILLISGFSFFVGSGGAPLASIELGRGDRNTAERILGTGTTMLAFFSVVLTVFFLIFKKPLLMLFGASEITLPYADEYLTVYLYGTVFVMFALGLNSFITCQGQARIAMLSVIIGAVINIVLDPIFIFTFSMGVKGAALATIISQCISAVWIVAFLISRRSSLRIKRETLTPDFKLVGRISALGISPFIMQATESLVNIVFNSGLQKYGGDIYVGSMTVLTSVMQIKTVLTRGFTHGCQPVISYNYGAHKFDRVKQTFRLMCICTISFSCLFLLSVFLFPGAFARIFTDEQELIELTKKVLPVYVGGMWIFGLQMSVQSTFLGLGQAKVSLFIACLRKVILLVPLALILPGFFGVMGIYWAEPIADSLCAITSGVIFYFMSKKLLADDAEIKV